MSGRKRAPQRRLGKRDFQFTKPGIAPELKPVFKRIGVPADEPFRPDPFQKEALELIEDYDVLVSAPTGAGKTWIAEQAISLYLCEGKRVWYASPLKALSNSIYQDFCREFGRDHCGILTGDRKENLDAPVIVGTTEILRNQLYDAMHQGTSLGCDMVIMDEAHYLSDPDRGVVWEEVLIYLPPRVRLLLLSATISNGLEICGWLRQIRETPNRVVKAEERPVPLKMLFLFPEGHIAPLGGKSGLNSRIKKFMGNRKVGRLRPEKIDYGAIINCLREYDLLPAIFFLKSRADCDRAVLSCPPAEAPLDHKALVKNAADSFLKNYPHLKRHRQLGPLEDALVGSHHGGQLPFWKIFIEKMMKRGYLEAIFSTSTVAAGVNFPARTVVLLQSDRFNGREFADLTATDLHQMIGRAGRRGKDNIGFALLVPARYQNPKLVYELQKGPPEPVMSQIHINFSMTLNLLRSHAPDEVKELLELSFAAFQERATGTVREKRLNRIIGEIEKILPEAACNFDDPYEITEYIKGRREIKRDIRRIRRQDRGVDSSEELHELTERLESFPCRDCAHFRLCHSQKKGRLGHLLGRFGSIAFAAEGTGTGLWLSFKAHLNFLKETGFVDEKDHLTDDGVWASNLRLDQPLLIAEAIRKDAFKDCTPEALASGLAPFVWDREQDLEIILPEGKDLSVPKQLFDTIMRLIEDIRLRKEKKGFSNPPLLYWPSIALYLWVKGATWEKLLEIVPVDEGDMASLIMRTADHLRQVMNLSETHPALTSVARDGIGLILREPVYIE